VANSAEKEFAHEQQSESTWLRPALPWKAFARFDRWSTSAIGYYVNYGGKRFSWVLTGGRLAFLPVAAKLSVI
jgi:hypothetical protein